MPTPRWQRRKDERPAELLTEALSCFAERGVDATSLDEIARRAGVTKGTIYHYFASKDELLQRAVEELAMPALAQLNALAATADAPGERLEAVMRRHWQLITTTQVGLVPRIIVAEGHRRAQLARRLFAAVGQHVFGLYARLLDDGARSGAFRPVDPVITAQQIVLPMVARALMAVAETGHALGSPQAFIDAHCATMRRWLAAEGGTA